MARTPRAEDAPLLRAGGRRETSDAPGIAVWLSFGMVLAGLVVLAIGAAPWGRAHVALVNGALYHPDTASTHREVRRAETIAPDGTETHASAPSPPKPPENHHRGNHRGSALGGGDEMDDETDDEMDERDAVFWKEKEDASGAGEAPRGGEARNVERSAEGDDPNRRRRRQRRRHHPRDPNR